MRRTVCLVCLFLSVGVFAVHGTIAESPTHLAGGTEDCYILESLLGGVSDAIAKLSGVPIQFHPVGYQMADRAFMFRVEAETEDLSTFLEPHFQQIFDRVGDLATSLLQGLPIYVGIIDSLAWSFDPQLWAVLTYNDTLDIVLRYVDASPSLLEIAREFSHALERELGEDVALAMDGCVAVPGLGAYVELRHSTYSPHSPYMPEDLDSYDEWESRLLDVVKSDGAALFEELATDESLCVGTPDGFYRAPDSRSGLGRMLFMIPSTTYLDTSTWQSWTQDW